MSRPSSRRTTDRPAGRPPAGGRRAFLGVAGGLTVIVAAGCGALPVIPKRPQPRLEDAVAWIRHADGRYVLTIPRVEMGQNVLTAMKRIACDELGVPWDRIDARLHGTRDLPRVRATVGSDSIREFGVPLAQACATLRDAIAEGRAQGVLEARARPIAELRAFAHGAPRTARVAPIEHGIAIVRGEPLYAADVVGPDLLHGRVLRAPASPELASRAVALDERAAAAVPGFVAIVRDARLVQGRAEGVGIVARTPGALERITAALAIRWAVDGAFGAADVDAAIDVDRRLATGALAHRPRRDAVDPGAPWDVDLRVDIPAAAHAAIEARAAVVRAAADGGLEAWVGHQDVFFVRDVLATRLGLARERIVVHGRRIGGAFGGRTLVTVELEAAVLADAVRGTVKVQWTRAQEFAQAFHRPPSSHRIRARLDGGRVVAWWHAFASSHVFFTNAAVPAWLQRLTDLVGDDGVARGAVPPYRFGATRVEFDLVRLPVLGGPWRGLGAGPNALAIESAIDVAARRAGADPVAFRIAHAEDPRLARVLRAAAAAAGPRPPSPPGRVAGRGVACGVYKGTGYAAVVADLEIDRADGTVRARALVCAHDCGRIVDPDQVRAQCEGNLVWGLGMVLVESLPIGASTVAASTFADSPIPRIGDVPPLRVVLVEDDDPPGGAGETAIVACAGAIANALHDAIGYRATRMPVRAADVLAFLRAGGRG